MVWTSLILVIRSLSWKYVWFGKQIWHVRMDFMLDKLLEMVWIYRLFDSGIQWIEKDFSNLLSGLNSSTRARIGLQKIWTHSSQLDHIWYSYESSSSICYLLGQTRTWVAPITIEFELEYGATRIRLGSYAFPVSC